LSPPPPIIPSTTSAACSSGFDGYSFFGPSEATTFTFEELDIMGEKTPTRNPPPANTPSPTVGTEMDLENFELFGGY